MLGLCTRLFVPFNPCTNLPAFLILAAHLMNITLAIQQMIMFFVPTLPSSSNDFTMEGV
jgi:hypothetical protein